MDLQQVWCGAWVLIQWVWDGTRESTFLRGSQMMTWGWLTAHTLNLMASTGQTINILSLFLAISYFIELKEFRDDIIWHILQMSHLWQQKLINQFIVEILQPNSSATFLIYRDQFFLIVQLFSHPSYLVFMFLEVKSNQVSPSVFITIFKLLLRSLLMLICNHSLSASALPNLVKRQPILDGAIFSGKRSVEVRQILMIFGIINIS